MPVTIYRRHLPDVYTYNGRQYTVNHKLSSQLCLGNLSLSTLEETARAQGLKIVFCMVLHPRLKGRTDLYGQPYQPTRHILTSPIKKDHHEITPNE